MKLNYFFTSILLFIHASVFGQDFTDVLDDLYENVDTIHIIRGSNNLYFSDSLFGISYIHFLGKGMGCIDPKSFSLNDVKLSSDIILSNINGVHEIPLDTSGPFIINNLACSDVFFLKLDTSTFHADAVIFDSYFEDVIIEVDDEKPALAIRNVISFIPEGYAKCEVIYIQKEPYIIVRSNIDGVLYTKWFRFGTCKQRSPLYIASRYAARGISNGIRQAVLGTKIGIREAARGIGIGGKQAARGFGFGLYGTATGIGKSVYNESRMFYKPSREFENMEDLDFEEKSISIDNEITIYTYHFKSESPKASVFLIHGNGGNVSTYKNMIRTLVSGNYNVYTIDWRGYGKSTGRPNYKGVLVDTKAAFDDFISCVGGNDSLKVIVYGMSLGGQIATKLVCDRQQEIDALILDGSLSSAQNLAIDFMPTEFIRNTMKKNANTFNQDYIAERDIQEIIDIPKLIIHSEKDNVVSFYHGERLYENAQSPKYFWKTQTRHIRTLEELPEESINRIDCLIDNTDIKSVFFDSE